MMPDDFFATRLPDTEQPTTKCQSCGVLWKQSLLITMAEFKVCNECLIFWTKIAENQSLPKFLG